jgi:hypothetical protein
VNALGLDWLSGAYLHKFTVCVLPSDETAQPKGPPCLMLLCVKMVIGAASEMLLKCHASLKNQIMSKQDYFVS